MIRAFIRMIYKDKQRRYDRSRMIICIPSGITDVEKRAVKDSAEHAGEEMFDLFKSQCGSHRNRY